MTTKAFVADGTSLANGEVIGAGGSVGVTADETMSLNVIAGNISGGGSAAVGAAVSVPVVSKETHAWIGNFAQVDGAGNGSRDHGRRPGRTRSSREGHALQPGVRRQRRRHDQHPLHGQPQGRRRGQLRRRRRHRDHRADRRRPLLRAGRSGDGAEPEALRDKDGTRDRPGSRGGSGENHRLFPTNQAAPTKDASPRFNPVGTAATSTTAPSTINLPYDPGGANGDAVVYSAGGGTADRRPRRRRRVLRRRQERQPLRLYTKDPNDRDADARDADRPGRERRQVAQHRAVGQVTRRRRGASGPRVIIAGHRHGLPRRRGRPRTTATTSAASASASASAAPPPSTSPASSTSRTSTPRRTSATAPRSTAA